MTLLLALTLLAACVDSAEQSVQACEDYYATLVCGEYDIRDEAANVCPSLADTACDVSDYFACLEAEFTCDEETGIPDFSGQPACDGLATCVE